MMNHEKSADRHLLAFSVVPSGSQARTVRHTFQTCQPRLLNPTLPDFSSVDQFPHFRLHVGRLHDRCPDEERFCPGIFQDRKSTRLNSSHVKISYAVFCLKKKKIKINK